MLFIKNPLCLREYNICCCWHILCKWVRNDSCNFHIYIDIVPIIVNHKRSIFPMFYWPLENPVIAGTDGKIYIYNNNFQNIYCGQNEISATYVIILKVKQSQGLLARDRVGSTRPPIINFVRGVFPRSPPTGDWWPRWRSLAPGQRFFPGGVSSPPSRWWPVTSDQGGEPRPLQGPV